MKLPLTTTPLAKAVVTTEGILLAIATAVPWIVTLVNTTMLSTADAAKYSAITGGILALSRTIIKVMALLRPPPKA